MGQYCFAHWRLSSVVVCNAAGGRAGRPPGTWAVGRATLHGGPVWLRPVRATPCCVCVATCFSCELLMLSLVGEELVNKDL